MSSGMSTIDYKEDEEDPLISHGSHYTSPWQQESEYESIPKPEPQPIILTQETDYTYGVTLSTHCTACYLKGQGYKCSDQPGHEWMRESVVSVSASALQLAIERKVYGMKEFQNYLEKYPDNNLRVQLQGNFCALFQHKDRHEYPGPEKDVEDVITEALEDNENRSLSPCRPNSFKPRVASKPTPNYRTSKKSIKSGRFNELPLYIHTEKYRSTISLFFS
ncbi:hypothetical protein NEUTE1DRAFT_46925 [Neurospora tetrasperma FGSC 2508]|uniref:Uncharacterized protein n=1 Tax=Neurospora tetrasperma (strain FGSC 2508 / ATCC MYA-4615 / P0657) TaxID=510951 RepID=F8MSH1_NEUT8|nr:uncharacterized protein NEUTE1DRAFT_46925 [Neurospora tetrasperma FGSC 2508]EGO55911.1 hypothetical protein NEUTE1DRAFT_46925 [Neurospora tetrasperma FGSC 2508]EGZ68833.1 hypothetical protein NEUTE2DRAFT_72617 [Neurospora tetrasperma FGSC 2509]